MDTNVTNPDRIYFACFSQDNTSLTIGTKTGYRVFSLHSLDTLQPIIYNNTESFGVHIVERLYNSCLMGIVSLEAPRKLKIRHLQKGNKIKDLHYSDSILSVKMSRQRLVVCLKNSLFIHDINDMRILHKISDTATNVRGLFSLSTGSDECCLAYPASDTNGSVQLFDALHLYPWIIINAHNSPLAALAFNHQSTILATASEKGTVIRVFRVHNGSKLFEFRRGVMRCVTMCSLAFSMDGSYLCSSSNTETVHVFQLYQPKDPENKACLDDSPSLMGSLSKAISATSDYIPSMVTDVIHYSPPWVESISDVVSASTSYLPAMVTDVFTQSRDIFSVYLPHAGMKSVCAIVSIEKILRLLIASWDGYLYIYNLDKFENGQCSLWKKHRLMDSSEEMKMLYSTD